MAIGSRIPGRSTIAGQFGVIEAEGSLVSFRQEVREVLPQEQLITFEQDVHQILPEENLITLQQRVVAGLTPPKPPAAYVKINNIILTCSTAYNNINITHSEGQQSTASLNVTYPSGSPINIPSFHGKSVEVFVHSDPNDIESGLVPLFKGWVERAKHNLVNESIEFTCTDLRDERLGTEDPQQIQTLTGALYSNITQRENTTGREYITELMKTVSGSLGYRRDGTLRYHSWGVDGKPTDMAMLGDVEYESVETEFQTRSSVINSVEVDMGYRWNKLYSVYTEVDAYKPRTWEQNRGFIDYKAWLRSNLLARIQSFNPWQTLDYRLYPLERVQAPFGANFIVLDLLWPLKERWSQGFEATLVRHIAQPVTERYSFKVVAPQSVDAYCTQVEGSKLTFTAEVEYERNEWEQDFIEAELANVPTAKQAEQSKADNRRADLELAFNCAYRMAKKEIVRSHRNSYVSTESRRIIFTDIGDVVSYDNQIVKTEGQLVGLDYSISGYGDVRTSLKVAISYMDTDINAPVEDWTPPTAPSVPESEVTLETVVTYDREEKAFDIKLPDISEQITDEYSPKVEGLVYNLPLEINDITLVNGY